MAMNRDYLQPLDPLRHKFVESLDKYLQETGLLVDAVEVALGQGAITGGIAGLLRERTLPVRRARFGED